MRPNVNQIKRSFLCTYANAVACISSRAFVVAQAGGAFPWKVPGIGALLAEPFGIFVPAHPTLASPMMSLSVAGCCVQKLSLDLYEKMYAFRCHDVAGLRASNLCKFIGWLWTCVLRLKRDSREVRAVSWVSHGKIGDPRDVRVFSCGVIEDSRDVRVVPYEFA